MTDKPGDELAIRDLTARFTDCVNRRAPKELARLFTEDGEWVVPGVGTVIGHEAVRTNLATLLDNFVHLVQLTHSGHIEVGGDTATARWYVSETAGDADGNIFEFTGVYTDELVRAGDGWLFQRRAFAFLFRRRAPAAARWYPHPDVVN